MVGHMLANEVQSMHKLHDHCGLKMYPGIPLQGMDCAQPCHQYKPTGISHLACAGLSSGLNVDTGAVHQCIWHLESERNSQACAILGSVG